MKISGTADIRMISRSELSVAAADQLRELIGCGEIRAGERLIETDLASALGISRTPVREALTQLRRDGLVVAHGGRGLSVRALSVNEVLEVYPLLAALERSALARCTAVSPATCEALDVLNKDLRGGRTSRERTDLDARWHRLLLEESPSGLTRELLAPLRTRARRYENLYMTPSDSAEQSYGEHAEIVTSLRSSRVQNAADLVEQHWLRSMVPLVDAVTEDSGLTVS